jgi:hypothetical protein
MELLPPEIQKITLEVIDGLPPHEYLQLCNTEDQAAHWVQLREDYGWLRQSLKYYFEGKPEPRRSQMTKANREACEFYDLWRDLYLNFYNVIRRGWYYIEDHAAAHGKLTYLEGFASSPGEALIRALENDCAAAMHPAVAPYYKWSPSKVRKMRSMEKDLKDLKAQSDGEPSQKYKNKLKALKHEVIQSSHGREPFLNFWWTCISICKAHQSEDPTLKRYIQGYQTVVELLDKAIASGSHESKGLRGEEWQHGYKKTLGQHGGV